MLNIFFYTSFLAYKSIFRRFTEQNLDGNICYQDITVFTFLINVCIAFLLDLFFFAVLQ